jgi:two-component system chemotaxis sensor kinase CheA
LPRTVRDTARSLGKQINLKIEGDVIRVDTALAQALSDSLIHIVRNSIDHGIEGGDKRVERRKNREGQILIRAVEKGEEVIVTIQDDGGGLDTERIKKKAVERGLYSAADIEQLSKPKIFSLIFESGFSTAQQVTDVSGRGVGMDMVRSSIQKVKGRIEIDSEIGKGTTFALHMPIPKSVLIISSLLVDAAGSSFALPQDSISRLIRLEGKRVQKTIKKLEGTYVFEFENHLIPIVDLGEILSLRPKNSVDYLSRDSQNILVVQTETVKFALAVDKILDSEEIVVKSVGRHLERAKVYGGATFMGDGSVGLILNANGIADLAGVTSGKATVSEDAEEVEKFKDVDQEEYLMFSLWNDGAYAVALRHIHRLEEFPRASFQTVGERTVVIYRDQMVPLVDVSAVFGSPGADLDAKLAQDPIPVFVVTINSRYVAFMIREIKDVCLGPSQLDISVRDRDEIGGCIEINKKVISVIDLNAILDKVGILKSFDPEGRLKKFAFGPKITTEESVEPSVKELASGDVPASGEATAFAGDGWGIF